MNPIPSTVLDDSLIAASNDIRRDRLAELGKLAEWMDNAFRIPGLGIRFGLDAVLGLIPIVGDALTFLVSLYILGAASHFGVPRITLVRMVLNIALDGLVGAVPFFGDVFDIFWKANQKNVSLLERYLRASPSELRRAKSADWLVVGGLMLGFAAGMLALMLLTWALFASVNRLLSGRPI